LPRSPARYQILTGWSEAIQAAGVQVTVLQRFSKETTFERNGVIYHFLRDAHRPELRKWRVPARFHRRVHDLCLRALRLVVDQCERVQLDVIGEDTPDGSIGRLAAALGLTEQVRFHGFLAQDEIVPFYQRTHLYVQSSLFENMPATVLEAAAAGVPTVGTAVGLVAEPAPSAALAVPVGDEQALAEGIISLLQNPELRERFGRAAQGFVRRYDADWTAAEFERTYGRLRRG